MSIVLQFITASISASTHLRKQQYWQEEHAQTRGDSSLNYMPGSLCAKHCVNLNIGVSDLGVDLDAV